MQVTGLDHNNIIMFSPPGSDLFGNTISGAQDLYKKTSSLQATNDTMKILNSGQNPTTQNSAVELTVSISKPISSPGETLTVGHRRSKQPGGDVAEAQADHSASLHSGTD